MIWIDYREKDLIAHIDAMMLGESFRICNLPIGDIVIGNAKTDNETAPPNTDEIHCILERKTVADMAASIRDGRYEEQSFRLNDSSVPNHNIVYVIEGDHNRELLANQYSKNKITPEIMYSVFASVMFFKGFSLYNSRTTQDTASFIVSAHRKLQKELYGPTRKPRRTLYHEPHQDPSGATYNVSGHSLRKKSSYTTTEGVHIAMLCQVPGVSETIAKAIISEYGTIPTLMTALNENPMGLDDFKCGAKRLSRSTVEALKAVLVTPKGYMV